MLLKFLIERDFSILDYFLNIFLFEEIFIQQILNDFFNLFIFIDINKNYENFSYYIYFFITKMKHTINVS
jgi:hypothetical protein